jgi:hypothetical protein
MSFWESIRQSLADFAVQYPVGVVLDWIREHHASLGTTLVSGVGWLVTRSRNYPRAALFCLGAFTAAFLIAVANTLEYRSSVRISLCPAFVDTYAEKSDQLGAPISACEAVAAYRGRYQQANVLWLENALSFYISCRLHRTANGRASLTPIGVVIPISIMMPGGANGSTRLQV